MMRVHAPANPGAAERATKGIGPLIRVSADAFAAALGSLARGRNLERRIETEILALARESPDPELARIFGVARDEPRLRPRLIRAPQWEAAVGPSFNPRSGLRFLTVYYHRADGPGGQRAMISALMDAYRLLPFDYLKIRLPGRIDPIRATELHPRAIVQLYVVVGRLDSAFARRHMRSHPAARGFQVVIERDLIWIDQLLALVREQETIGPGIERLGDAETAIASLPEAMEHVMTTRGGRVVNLYRDRELVGHVSVVPEHYPEPVGRVQHIEHLAVRGRYRGRGLGRLLQILAAGVAEPRYGTWLAGLIRADNPVALACAATYGRAPVESHVVVPRAAV